MHIFHLSDLRFVFTTTKTWRFCVRQAGFMNLKIFSLEIKCPILTQKRLVFVVVLTNLQAPLGTMAQYSTDFFSIFCKVSYIQQKRFIALTPPRSERGRPLNVFIQKRYSERNRTLIKEIFPLRPVTSSTMASWSSVIFPLLGSLVRILPLEL